MIAYMPFVPHTLEHLSEARVFPQPLPEIFYRDLQKEYDALEGVTAHRITYPSGNLTVTGIAVLPAEITPGKHPILIYNRGGSREYGKLTLLSVMRSMAPFAEKGYLVFASNYRGNDGGEGQEEFGGADVQDVLSLVELAKKHAGWDGRNLFMLGHSRGGMMTFLAQRHGLTPTASVTLAAMLDLFSSSSENMEKLYHRLIPQFSSRRDEALTERSPVLWPEKITSPTLLLHSIQDDVVPHTHSERMAEGLKSAGKPHQLHIYERGNHALVRVWDDVLTRSHHWFEEHRL